MLGLERCAHVIRDQLAAIPAVASVQSTTGLISPRILPKAGPRELTRLESVLAGTRGISRGRWLKEHCRKLETTAGLNESAQNLA